MFSTLSARFVATGSWRAGFKLGEGAHGIRHRDEVTRPITAIAGPQVHPLAVLMGDDAEAVVFELVDPAVPGRHLVGEDGLAREDEAGRPDELRPSPAGRAAHQHGAAPLTPGRGTSP